MRYPRRSAAARNPCRSASAARAPTAAAGSRLARGAAARGHRPHAAADRLAVAAQLEAAERGRARERLQRHEAPARQHPPLGPRLAVARVHAADAVGVGRQRVEAAAEPPVAHLAHKLARDKLGRHEELRVHVPQVPREVVAAEAAAAARRTRAETSPIPSGTVGKSSEGSSANSSSHTAAARSLLRWTAVGPTV